MGANLAPHEIHKLPTFDCLVTNYVIIPPLFERIYVNFVAFPNIRVTL